VLVEDPAHRCAELLASLASPERLRIMRLLRDGPRNVTELGALLGLPPEKLVNVSHHLNVLRHAGLVRNEKRGRCVYYSLAPGTVLPDGECDRLDLGCCRLEMPRPRDDK
jgi:DNA-binding transcriptional ArsR family regulator